MQKHTLDRILVNLIFEPVKIKLVAQGGDYIWFVKDNQLQLGAGFENDLHYRRDSTLREDATRMSSENQAQVMATLNNFIIGLANKLHRPNLAFARRHFDAQLILLLAAFT